MLNIRACMLISKPADNTRHYVRRGTYFQCLQRTKVSLIKPYMKSTLIKIYLKQKICRWQISHVGPPYPCQLSAHSQAPCTLFRFYQLHVFPFHLLFSFLLSFSLSFFSFFIFRGRGWGWWRRGKAPPATPWIRHCHIKHINVCP